MASSFSVMSAGIFANSGVLGSSRTERAFTRRDSSRRASAEDLRLWQFDYAVDAFHGVVDRHANDRMTLLDDHARRLSGVECCK
jgi:hypothetical protein